MSIIDVPSPAAIVDVLLDWIGEARRDLPWRRRRDPYAVWISEVMLQQTQVATVVPYFHRWMKRFPAIETLAGVPQEAVLKAWEGLGYYARARNLHRAAKLIMTRHGGLIPADRDALLALPGIGRYTVGAILSLAFGQAEPILDGNVRRVLCRVYDIDEDPRDRETEKRLWRLAADLVTTAPADQAGTLNEALMELGALICTPGIPDCASCPLAEGPSRDVRCAARSRGVENLRPVKTPRRRPPHHDITAAVLCDRNERYLIIQRPQDGLLGGLWGFPGGGAEPGEAMSVAVTRTVEAQTGVRVIVDTPLVQIRHAYTHFRITLYAFRCTYLSGQPRPLGCADVRWVDAPDLADYPFPVTDQRLLHTLGLR